MGAPAAESGSYTITITLRAEGTPKVAPATNAKRGETNREALRCLKRRQHTDIVFTAMRRDTTRARLLIPEKVR
jgi:hypothetical protein